jgi:hypothetical protein
MNAGHAQRQIFLQNDVRQAASGDEICILHCFLPQAAFALG